MTIRRHEHDRTIVIILKILRGSRTGRPWVTAVSGTQMIRRFAIVR